MQTVGNNFSIDGEIVKIEITGGKHQGVVLLDKSDFYTINGLHIGLEKVGGSSKLRPVVYINRASVALGRYLLDVDKSELKVCYINRNPLDCRRSNLYIRHKNELHKSKHQKDIVGVFEIKRKSGNISGYKVEYRDTERKKRTKCFMLNTYLTLEKCLEEAKTFRLKQESNIIGYSI